MLIIMSAAYIDKELASEFGDIPPTFLPLGNKRLFQHQIAASPKQKRVYLSLPDDFTPNPADLDWLLQHNVAILRVPVGLPLGASLVSSLNLIEDNIQGPVSILFGDTLITDIPSDKNVVAVSEIEDNYNWSVISQEKDKLIEPNHQRSSADNQNVVAGYFNFSQPKQLIRSLTHQHWDFVKGLNDYHQQVGMCSARVNNWLDFGHVNTYYHSKAKFTTQRAFNELDINPPVVTKSGNQKNKIEAEANWFKHLPGDLKVFTPQFLGSYVNQEKASYQLEYLHLTALNELYVFAQLPDMVWQRILNACFAFIDKSSEHQALADDKQASLGGLFQQKTLQRVTLFCKNNQLDADKIWQINQTTLVSINQLCKLSEQYLPAPKAASLMHGDFCFSNILYDFRTNNIKTIDPRGIDHNGNMARFGDIQYDLAKLSHSVLGMYDWIIAGYFSLTYQPYQISFELHHQSHNDAVQNIFLRAVKQRYRLNAANIYAMQIQLFLSMLPLHSDQPERQQALLANAFRLFELLQQEVS
ncbi:capsular biosynthesis protein [Motilimonas pumila]|uniref:Capsular biosynthesis protein n=1 Tax=Motilimonas pumila TaxID=2303987 RepID=A0A418YHL1_9GAMM|nr:capsular biosynthesis protein [Motilimonas pumila]RJG49545.1 capsular biosynthesis protein [Motilimonas pumila]